MMRWLVLAVLLGGCMGTESGDDSGTQSQTATSAAETSSTTDVPAPILEPPTRPDRMLWTGCTGIASEFLWPLNTNPAPAFPGWEPAADTRYSSVEMMGWECQRFGFGDIERGPIRFLIETHNGFAVPQGKCEAEEGPIFYWILTLMLVDDAEVARVLRESEGLPAVHAPMTTSGASDTGLPTRTWEWTPEGAESSGMQVVQELPSADRFPKLPGRWYWQNHLQGVSFMDVTFEALGASGPPNVDGPYLSQRPMTGTMREPMIMASLSEDYAGFGNFLDEGHFESTLHRFGDMTCENSS